jgi:hypothetical protein
VLLIIHFALARIHYLTTAVWSAHLFDIQSRTSAILCLSKQPQRREDEEDEEEEEENGIAAGSRRPLGLGQ